MNKEVMVSRLYEVAQVLRNMLEESRELELKGYLHVPATDIESALLEVEKSISLLQSSAVSSDGIPLENDLQRVSHVLRNYERQSFKWSNIWFLKRDRILDAGTTENGWQVVS